MSTCNLWVEPDLVNGALAYIETIFFVPGSMPPQLPQFVTVMFESIVVFHFIAIIQILY